MGLAPYGEPVYAELFTKHLIDLKDDGSFRMDMSYFNYCQGLTMTSAKFHRLFGGPPRKPESPITQRDMDLAASVQAVTEEIMLRMARHVHKMTGARKLCLAGGVALNCVANGRILRESPFEDLWIQPAAGDAGGALGAALFVHHQLLGHPRTPQPADAQQGSLLGPEFSDAEIERFLRGQEATYTRYDSDEALCEAVATSLADGEVVGWFQGRMEFGPRALGARSLLGDARNPEMQAVMNLKIKFRESFRPFAPSVLRDRVDEYFEVRPNEDSPYMLLVAPVRPEKRVDAPGAGNGNGEHAPLRGFDKLKVPRSVIPAVTHVDLSARIQTVDPERFPLYDRLLRAFEERTGCPVIINTSFNVRGEPIVLTPADAYRCFQTTHVDVLALGRFVVRKAGQRPLTQTEVTAHLAQFPLD
jgi:carbamoyltransferase